MDGLRNRNGYGVTMDMFQHLVDEGKVQGGSIRQRGSAAVLELHVKAGAKPVLVLISAYAGLATPIDVIRGVTITGGANGTAKKVFNRNGGYPNDNLQTKCFVGPTYTGGETSKETQAGMGTAPGTANAGNSNPDVGYVIPANTSWVFKFSPSASTDLVVLWDLVEEMK